MIAGETLLNAFVDANILLVVAFLLWSVTQLALDKLGPARKSAGALWLLNTVFLTIVLSPVVVACVDLANGWGLASPAGVNFSEMAVARFLAGDIAMKASDFERLMQTREAFTSDVLRAAGWTGQLAILAFLAGCLIGGLRLARSVFHLSQIASHAHTWRRFGRVRLKVSDRTLVPFSTRGLWYYDIVIPSDMLPRHRDLQVALAHEFQHLRQGDIAWEFLLEALKPFFYLNPAFHAWKRRVEDLRELRCDLRVLSRGRITSGQYCDTLLNTYQAALRRDRSFVVAVPKVALVTAGRGTGRGRGLSLLERRIQAALANRHHGAHRLHVLLAVPLCALVLLTAVAIQQPGDWSHNRLMLSSVVNLERLDEINRLSAFGRLRN